MSSYHAHRLMRLLLLLGAITGLVLSASVASAELLCIDDLQGADDEPGQKDLNRLCIDDAPPPPDELIVSFNWDQAGWTGANTGDACTLFDTNGNGNADYSLCVTVHQTPAQYLSTRLYQCTTDSWADRCHGAVEIGFNSVCTAEAVDGADPFHVGEADTVATCSIVLADFGDPLTVELLDVCTYPSEQPNSDPSDCVISPSTPTAISGSQVSAIEGAEAMNTVLLLAFAALLAVTAGVALRLYRPAGRREPARPGGD